MNTTTTKTNDLVEVFAHLANLAVVVVIALAVAI